MKKALKMILPCALTLSMVATPVLAADSNAACKGQNTAGRNAQIVQKLNEFGGQWRQGNAKSDINSLLSQLFSGKNCSKFPLLFNWGEVSSKNNCPTNKDTCGSTGCDEAKDCSSSNCTDDSCSSSSCNNGSSCADTESSSEAEESASSNSSSDSSSSSSSDSSSSSSSDSSSSPSSDATDNSSSSSSADENATGSYREFQKRVIELVNEERAAYGLGALKENAELDKVATLKSQDMADLNYFSHTSPTYGSPFDMLSQFGITYTAAGENIAMGQPTPESVMTAWMNSEGHRANILNSNYDEIGVGIVKNANGQYIWTQTFLRQ